MSKASETANRPDDGAKKTSILRYGRMAHFLACFLFGCFVFSLGLFRFTDDSIANEFSLYFLLAVCGLALLLQILFRGTLLAGKSPLNLPILLLALWFALQFLFPQDNAFQSFRVCVRLLSGLALYLIAGKLLTGEADTRRVIWGLLACGLVVSVHVIAQSHFIYPHAAKTLANPPEALVGEESFQTETRIEFIREGVAQSNFQNPNACAGFLAMLAPLALAAFLRHREKKSFGFAVFLQGFLIFLLFWAMMLTKSRGALICAVGGMVLFWLLSQSKWRAKALKLCAALWLCAMSIVITLSFFPPDLSSIDGHFREHRYSGFLGGQWLSSITRARAWKSAGDLATQDAGHFLWGGGGSSFGERYATCRTPEGDNISLAHNLYLEILVDYGLPGLLLLLWLVYRLYKIVFWNLERKADHPSRDHTFFFLCSGLAALLFAFVMTQAFPLEPPFGLRKFPTTNAWVFFVAFLCLLWWVWYWFSAGPSVSSEAPRGDGFANALTASSAVFLFQGFVESQSNVPALWCLFFLTLALHRSLLKDQYAMERSVSRVIVLPVFLAFSVIVLMFASRWLDRVEERDLKLRDAMFNRDLLGMTAEIKIAQSFPGLTKEILPDPRIFQAYYNWAKNAWLFQQSLDTEEARGRAMELFRLAEDCNRKAQMLAPYNARHCFEEGALQAVKAGLLRRKAAQEQDPGRVILINEDADKIYREKVLPAYQRAALLYPSHPFYEYLLANVHVELAQLAEAKKHFAKALELNERQWKKNNRLRNEQVEEIKKQLRTPR